MLYRFLHLVFRVQFVQVKPRMSLGLLVLQANVSRRSAIAAAVADAPAEDQILQDDLHRTVRVRHMFLLFPILILRIHCFLLFLCPVPQQDASPSLHYQQWCLQQLHHFTPNHNTFHHNLHHFMLQPLPTHPLHLHRVSTLFHLLHFHLLRLSHLHLPHMFHLHLHMFHLHLLHPHLFHRHHLGICSH